MRDHTVRPGMVVCSAMALLIVSFASELGAYTYPRQPGIDARHYAVRLTLLTSDANEIQAEATVTLRLVTPGTREAVLDLTSLTPDGKGMTVTSVTSDGRVVPIDHRDNRLHLPVPAGAAAGQDVTVTITYHGAPGNQVCAPSTTSTAIARRSARTVQPRAPMAADDRPSRRQSHRRVDRDDEG